MNIEIVLLAMVALFVGLRLYAVLGRRTGHEQQPVTRPEAVPGTETAAPVADLAPELMEGSRELGWTSAPSYRLAAPPPLPEDMAATPAPVKVRG